MSNLRLADEVIKAAKYVTAHEDIDVEVLCADGSRTLYVKGDERDPVWMAAPMPQMQPGQSASELCLTPTQIRLGHWHEESGKFISSNTFSAQQFLEIHRGR